MYKKQFEFSSESMILRIRAESKLMDWRNRDESERQRKGAKETNMAKCLYSEMRSL